MIDVNIAVVPRDRFSKTALTVTRLLEETPQPYRLIVVDAGMPTRYRRDVERAQEGGELNRPAAALPCRHRLRQRVAASGDGPARP